MQEKQTKLVNELKRNSKCLNLKVLKNSSNITKATEKNKKIQQKSKHLEELFNKISTLLKNLEKSQLNKINKFYCNMSNSINESRKKYVIKNILMLTTKTQLSSSNNLRGIIVKNNLLQHFEFHDTSDKFEMMDKMWNFLECW